jgi:hypothetical protein
MPEIAFTSHERSRIEQILQDLEPATHELTRHFSDQLSSDDWGFVRDYVRAKTRAVLETGLLMRAAAELSRASRLVDELSIRRNFLHTLWTYNFSFQSEIESTFVDIAGDADSALCIAVEGLIELAEDAMFNTFEDAHALLLKTRS